jgi:AcrR family transcriptional regulator
MDINTNRDLTMNTVTRQKLRKKERILESAIELFCDLGIETTKMEDIALESNVGTATVYRYFSTKAELAIQSATLFWKMEADRYLDMFHDKTYHSLTGIQQVEEILHRFGKLYDNSPRFLKFLQEFDSFVKRNAILPESLIEYENTILNLKPYFTSALEKGVRDQTIVIDFSVEETYFTITHTMLSLMQKLALSGDILDSDARVAAQAQIKIIIQLIVKGLKRSDVDERANK